MNAGPGTSRSTAAIEAAPKACAAFYRGIRWPGLHQVKSWGWMRSSSATFVAVGTSTPELATTLIARLRGHSEIGLGTIVGSNIYNGGFIIAIAAFIHPIEVNFREVGAAIGFGLALVALLLNARGLLGRRLGLMFLALYVAYVAVLITSVPDTH